MHCVWIGKDRRDGLGRTHPLETSRAKPGEDGTASDALHPATLRKRGPQPGEAGLEESRSPHHEAPTSPHLIARFAPRPRRLARPYLTIHLKEGALRGFPSRHLKERAPRGFPSLRLKEGAPRGFPSLHLKEGAPRGFPSLHLKERALSRFPSLSPNRPPYPSPGIRDGSSTCLDFSNSWIWKIACFSSSLSSFVRQLRSS